MAETKPTTPEELNAAIEKRLGRDPLRLAHDKYGITMDLLARLHKQGLGAKVTKTMKVKGLVRQEDLPRGFKVVATSGTVVYDKEGNPEASTGDTVIMWQEVSHEERRLNRIDAQKMIPGVYPNEKLDLNVIGPITFRVIYDDKPKGGEDAA